MHLHRLLLLYVSSNSRNRYWEYKLPCIRAHVELINTLVYDYEMSSGLSVLRGIRTSTGGTNANDTHASKPNHIRMQIKLSRKATVPYINFRDFLKMAGKCFSSLLLIIIIILY